jgi:AAA+ ATPase superfamily predicted ATPase
MDTNISFGNSLAISNVETWLETKNKKNVLLIFGPSSCGKTWEINRLTNSDKWKQIYDFFQTEGGDVIETITKGIGSSLMNYLNTTNRQKVVIIDEFELSINMDRTVVSSLTALILKHSKTLFIMKTYKLFFSLF